MQGCREKKKLDVSRVINIEECINSYVASSELARSLGWKRKLTARRETIKEPDPSVLKRFELAVPKDAHVGQDSCTRTLLVAFQSLKHTPRTRLSDQSNPCG